jgi:hypothetical protein
MIPTMPAVFLASDPCTVQARHGVFVAATLNPIGRGRVVRTLWRFGFEPGSDLARAFFVSSAQALWVLSFHTGTVIRTCLGGYGAPEDAGIPSVFCRVAGPASLKPAKCGGVGFFHTNEARRVLSSHPVAASRKR